MDYMNGNIKNNKEGITMNRKESENLLEIRITNLIKHFENENPNCYVTDIHIQRRNGEMSYIDIDTIYNEVIQ